MKARPEYKMAASAIRSVNQEEGLTPQITLKSNKARDDLDPQKRNWLIWLSQNWETYFADNRHTVSWSSTQWHHQTSGNQPASGKPMLVKSASWRTPSLWDGSSWRDNSNWKWTKECAGFRAQMSKAILPATGGVHNPAVARTFVWSSCCPDLPVSQSSFAYRLVQFFLCVHFPCVDTHARHKHESCAPCVLSSALDLSVHVLLPAMYPLPWRSRRDHLPDSDRDYLESSGYFFSPRTSEAQGPRTPWRATWSLAAWPTPRSPQVMSPTSSWSWNWRRSPFPRIATRRPSTIRT